VSPALPLLLLTLGAGPERVSFVFGGDVIPHAAVKQVARANDWTVEPEDGGEAASRNHDGWDHVFGPLAGYLSVADVAVVNMETPLTESKRPLRGFETFSAPPSLAEGLRAAGVDVAMFANNHCLDQGRPGIVETRRLLDEVGLQSGGAAKTKDEAWRPLVLEAHGLRVGLLGFTRFLNDHLNGRASQPYVPIVHYRSQPEAGGLNEKQLVEKVRAAAEQVDALVVVPHWGNEDQETPREDDRKLAKAMLEAGAAVIVGSHPHVLQPVEAVTRDDGTVGLVAFSLGNLVSNQGERDAAAATRDGMLLRFELVRADGAVRVENVSVVPVFTANRSAKKGRNVQPVVLAEERTAMQARLEELAARTDKASREEQKQLTRRLRLATAREKRILGLVSPAWSERGPVVSAKP